MRVTVVAGPDPGHLLPATAVAAACRDRGHRVTVLTTPRWADDLQHAGLAFAELPQVTPEPPHGDLGWRIWGQAAAMAHGVKDTLARSRPDAVIVDTLTAAGGFAAELLGLPWVELVPHWLWAPSTTLPPIGLGQRPARTTPGRLLERYQRRLQARSFAEGREQRRRAHASTGLSVNGGPDLRLLATFPALEPPRPDWPPRTFVVGPLEWEPPSWPRLDPPSGASPLVVVTDSTASGVEESLAARFVTGLGDDDLRLAVTSEHPQPERAATVVGRGAHGPLLDAAACAAGPAGHGFVSKALRRGVPLVLVPIQGDQRETAARVARAGAAVVVAPEDASPRRLADAVRTVVSGRKYRAAARRLGASAAGLGPQRAAVLVERRLQRGGRDARG